MEASGKETVSVVIPVRNRPELIVRCLDSVRAQSHRPIHLIVVDNASTDNTAEVVARYFESHPEPGIRYTLLREEKPGACAARNRGLSAVTSRMVYFFDSDDTMHPDLLEKGMAASEGADIVSWECRLMRPDGTSSRKSRLHGRLIRRQMFNAFFRTQAYMVDAGFLRRSGAWNEEAAVWNDWELGIRLMLAEPRHRHIPLPLADIYPQPQSITGTSFHAKAGAWENTLRIVGSEVSGRPDSRRLREMVDYRRAILAAIYAREGRKDLARELLRKTLAATSCSPARKALLRFIFRYTALGGRAAYILWR